MTHSPVVGERVSEIVCGRDRERPGEKKKKKGDERSAKTTKPRRETVTSRVGKLTEKSRTLQSTNHENILLVVR